MFQEPVSLAVCYESDGRNKTIEQYSITFAIFMVHGGRSEKKMY